MIKVKRDTSTVIIRKSVGAAILIGLGDFALLKLGNPIGPVIFALGLLGVCYLGQNLFTGKCGFLFENKKLGRSAKDLALILVVNLLSGFLIGKILAVADESVVEIATGKVSGWSYSLPFLIKSLLCGIVMFVAVKMYKEGTALGILFGIPLFIFSGFQHCIANVITLGVAGGLSVSAAGLILVCAVGNFLGAVLMWWIAGGKRKRGI